MNMSTIKFQRKEKLAFTISITFIVAGFLCITMDTAPNGFGVLTLYVAPPLLLSGFFIPVMTLMFHQRSLRQFSLNIQREKGKHFFALIAFAVSFIVYCLTLEPTASLWDCAEFIAAAYKLQVPHTPGTPLSLLIARMFTMASFGNVHQVAWTVNFMSALFSALTVFLTYYVIYTFGEAILARYQKKSGTALIGASLCGSMCLAFSDSFWFSAVEAETYALACFFLMLLLFLILKGKNANPDHNSRQLILIAYLTGLSYCIHPMCLLVIPLLPFVWHSSDKNLTIRNILFTVSIGLSIVLVVNRVVAVGLFEGAFYLDLILVNKLHFPFYAGAILFVILLIAVLIFLVRKYPRHSTYTWSIAFLLFGFSPYLLLFIRSNHNPPIDESNPENLPLIKAYMNREGYPTSPLLYGPYFDADIKGITAKKNVYYKDVSMYKVAGRLPEYHYEKSRQTILPRMFSRDESHIETYRRWTGLKPNEKPGFIHNIKYLINYQLGHMYLRYFLWNFAGRESDVMHSAWLKPWDDYRPLTNGSKARNQYWMIPLLLGIAGMVFQYKNDRKGFLTNTIFFLITGIILVVYLNSTPNEPRERDYIYVGSYISFSIWIGMGVLSLYQILPPHISLIAMICLAVPAWMYLQNIDDHDRSGRTFHIDHARMTLNSCPPNAMLFTGGDNDTFPLWYLQEVEGLRTDVRVVVLSYFNTDWYINQLRKQYYDSPPFRLTLEPDDYRQYGPNDVLYVSEKFKHGIDASKLIQLLKNDPKALKMLGSDGDPYHIIPSKSLIIKTKNNKVPADMLRDRTESEMTLTLNQNFLPKNVLAILDLIVSNNWSRPMYFNFTSANALEIDFSNYLQQEGTVFRLLPAKANRSGIVIHKELMYTNLIEKTDYSNLHNKKIYFSYEDHFARIIVPLRQAFNQLAEAWLEDGNYEMARNVLHHAVSNLYPEHLPPSFADLQAASMLFFLKENESAKELTARVFDHFYITYSASITNGNLTGEFDLRILQRSAKMLLDHGYSDYMDKLNALKENQ